MKAWYIWVKDSGEGGEIHWGETAGKAKVKARQQAEIIQVDEWPDICAQRAPAFDGEVRTLTARDWIEAGYSYPCFFCECPVTKEGRYSEGDTKELPVFSEDGAMVWCSAYCQKLQRGLSRSFERGG